MTVATALVTGNDPLPQLAEEAVSVALDKTGLSHANGVLLFLTPEFSRHAQAAITATARRARCTQVAGSIASGVFTESGWTLDRPAAAVMILGGGLSIGHPNKSSEPLMSLAAETVPPGWLGAEKRFGATFGGIVNVEPSVWQQSRLSDHKQCEAQLLGAHVVAATSTGFHLLGKPHRVEDSNAYDLKKLGGKTALASLTRALPIALRQRPTLPWHHLIAVLMDAETWPDLSEIGKRCRPLAIVTANGDDSLTLADRVRPGQFIGWALRDPTTSEAAMRQTVNNLADHSSPPVGALMFSCIGRGPYFYGGEDHDLDILCNRFPGLPLLGAYGTGQIAPASGSQPCNRELQNAAVIALISKSRSANVQPIA